MRPVLRVRRAEWALDLPLPEYATPGSAGLDLRSAEDAVLEPGDFRAISTGLFLEIPPGFEGQIRPRSGLALKHGVTVLNAPGTVDSDYRGEVKVLLVNLGKAPFEVKRGDRIAQLVISPCVQVELSEAKELSPTVRSEGGFGSTGTR